MTRFYPPFKVTSKGTVNAMAVDYSKEYIKNTEETIRYTYLSFVLKFPGLIKKIRSLKRGLAGHKNYPSHAECRVTANLEAGAKHFQKQGWVLLEDILARDFHQELIKNWPKRYFLEPPKKLVKSYDLGFVWTYGQINDPLYLDRYPAIAKIFNYLRSEEFCKRIKEFVGLTKDFVCYSFLLNITYPGSQVAPHKDGVYNNTDTSHFLNIIFFINGIGGKASGGLALARDNELKDIIIEPQKLINTALIYDSKANFYHGFKPVEPGKFRWAINAQFCEKDFVDKAAGAG